MKNLLLIAITILAVGCSGKDESTTETKPVEEKVVEVKEEVNLDELEDRESIWYLKDSETPYTGKVYSLHPNGQKERETNFKGGKKDGLEVWWYDNGQKLQEENYKDGKEDGLSMSWYDNGQKHLEALYKDGWPDGLQVGWHENGQKAYEEIYMNGEEVEGSAKYWNNKGEEVDSLEEAEAE